MAIAAKRTTSTAVAKTAAKPVAKRPAARTATPAPAAPAKPVQASPALAAEPSKKARKIDAVRSSFNLAASEYASLTTLKKSLGTKRSPVKKGQLIRAGLALLRDLPAAQIHAIVATLPTLKAPAAKK